MMRPEPNLSEYFLSEEDLHDLLQHLAADRPDPDVLLGYADEIAFSAGDILIEQGEVDASVLILTSGELAVVIDDEDGEGRTVADIRPYALVGEHSFIDGGPRTATVMARTDGVAHRLTDEAFERVRAEHPDLACAFLIDVARALSRRWRAHLGAE